MTLEQKKEAVKKGVRCESFLSRSKGNMYCCPFCHSGEKDKKTGAVKVYDDNGWTCHACGKSGDVITLIQQLYNLEFSDAVEYGMKLLGSGEVKTGGNKATKEKPPKNVDFLGYYEICTKRLTDKDATDYLSKRGISYDTAHRLFVGYDPKADPAQAPGGHGEITNPVKRLIFPTKKDHYVTRQIDGDGEYSKLNNKGGTPGIFNEKALADNDVIFVSEGVFDALSYEELGYHAVAINSTSNVDKLLTTVKDKGSSALFIISFDNDPNKVTNERTRKAEKKLSDGLTKMNIRNMIVNIAGEYKDANVALVENRNAFTAAVAKAYSDIKTAGLPVHIAVEQPKPTLATQQEEVPPLETFDADYFNNTDIPEPKPIIDKLLYPGLGMLGSPAKMGKSYMMLQLAVAVATGESFLGFDVKRPGSVLYLDLQGTKARTKKRLASMGYDTMPKGITLAYRARNTDNGFIQQIEQWITAADNPSLVIIDMMEQIKGSQRRTEDSYRSDNRILEPLHDIALKHDISVFGVMHTRKGYARVQPDDPFNEIIGSVAQFGTADCAWMILGKRDEDKKQLSVICRDNDDGQQDYEAIFQDHRWTVSGTVEEIEEKKAVTEYENNPVVFTIRNLIKESGGGWCGTMSDLLHEVTTRTNQYPASTPEKLKSIVNTLTYRLHCEGIEIDYPNKNGGSKGRKYKFYRKIPQQMTHDI